MPVASEGYHYQYSHEQNDLKTGGKYAGAETVTAPGKRRRDRAIGLLSLALEPDSHPVSLISILILSSQISLRLGIPSGIIVYLSSFSCVLHMLLISSFLI
jgi:hypothetical protein